VTSFDPPPAEDFVDLYDNAPCGYLSLSPDAHVVMANRTLAGWLGREVPDILSRSVHELFTFGGRIAFETHLAPLLRLQGFVHELALDLIDVNGNKIPVIVNAAERRGPDGAHHFTRLTMFKAIDRRTYERSLLEAQLKAEEAAKSEHRQARLRDQFIAVLGHDLRNPLAAVSAGISLLNRQSVADERSQLIMSEMQGSIDRAHALINNVMDFARGSFGDGLSLKRDTVRPIVPILAQVVKEQCAISPDWDIRDQIKIEHEIDSDVDRIGQLAANLLANAIAHGAPDKPVMFEAYTSTDRFFVSVSNGGPPIPDSVRGMLFQPFVRGDSARERKGLGLGLFIVHEIAKAHGGVMEVNSTDVETRFTFTMPRVRDDPLHKTY
jgi:phosphoserine phosphatase RsbU/P